MKIKFSKRITISISILTILLFLSLACNMLTGPRGSEDEFTPVCTPPACKPGEKYYCYGECPGGCGTTCKSNTIDYNGCAFIVNVPAELSTQDIGWDVWFTPVSGQPGWVSINARKMPGASLKSAFEQAALRYNKQTLDPSSVASVIIMDNMDQPLPGL